mmetsp:Transcript_17196/g.50277  ORF Transcript_17196/g.50277 Transcript_17196/m.50277 type:complete len:80 (-) Transcript_17196:856-1095(-)
MHLKGSDVVGGGGAATGTGAGTGAGTGTGTLTCGGGPQPACLFLQHHSLFARDQEAHQCAMPRPQSKGVEIGIIAGHPR